jgi:hypothetical protein
MFEGRGEMLRLLFLSIAAFLTNHTVFKTRT